MWFAIIGIWLMIIMVFLRDWIPFDKIKTIINKISLHAKP